MSRHIRKIRILRDEQKAVIFGMLPNDAIVGSVETKLSNRFGDSGRTAASCGDQDTALPIRRIRQAGADVFLGELRVVTEDFLVRHPDSEPTEHIRDCDPHPADAWTTPAFAGF